MPQPTVNQVHVDRPLTNISIAYLQSQGDFIASRVFPIIPVDKQSDKYYTYNKNAWLRDQAEKRAPSTESAGGGYQLSTDNYYCDEWAYHKDIPEQLRANADMAIDVDRDATEFVTQVQLLRKEAEFASTYFNNSAWGANTGTPSTLWDVYATSTPITDIKDAARDIQRTTGRRPNKLTLSQEVFDVLSEHPDFTEKIKYTQTGIVTAQLMAGVLGLDEVIVAGSVQATNLENETEAYAFTFGKHALLTYSPMRPSLLTPSAGYMFAWRGLAPGLGDGSIAIDRFQMRHLKAERVEGTSAWDMKITGSDLGYFFESVIS